MTARVVNMAEDRRDAAGRCPCQARGCRNAARWSLTLDCGAEVHVCRLHANQGERTGRLELAAPLPAQIEMLTVTANLTPQKVHTRQDGVQCRTPKGT